MLKCKILTTLSPGSMKVEVYVRSLGSFEKHMGSGFDAVFESRGVSELWDRMKPISRGFTCMAYGHSGTGKTYTISHLIAALVKSLNHCATLRAIEIYNNELYDLLNGRKKLRTPSGASAQIFRDVPGYNNVMQQAQHNRVVRATNLNHKSSRSHVLWTISNASCIVNFVDLAGAEAHSGAESSHINTSLYFLRDSIQRLRAGKSIQARQSKLTWSIFERGLQNVPLYCVCTVDPRNSHHTKRTLEYGMSVKGLKRVHQTAHSSAVIEAQKYITHTKRLCELETKLALSVIAKPHKNAVKLLRSALQHRLEVVQHMLSQTA